MAFTVNEHNMIVDAEKICFGSRKGYCMSVAEISVGSHEGKWFLGLSMNLPHEGMGRGVQAQENEYNPAYGSKDEAVEEGKNQAMRWLRGRIEYGLCESHEAIALACLREIEDSKQLSLF